MDKVKQAQEMGYDRSVGMFSPDGLLLQVEYAEKAVKLGSAVIAMVTKEGVTFVADRKIKSKLLVKESFKKITEIDNSIAVSGAGVMSDGRRLIEQAQIIAQEHRVRYQGAIDILSLIKEIANIQQYYSQAGGLRPFGVNLIFGAIEEGEAIIFQTTASGMYFRFLARAVGNNSDKMNDALETEYKENMTHKDAVKLALKIFKSVMDDEEKFDIDRFDVANLTLKGEIVRMKTEELKKL